MYCSYSGFNTWEKCNFQYWHRYINETRPPELDNRVNMLFGTVVGLLFEQFYNEKLWRQCDFAGVLLSRIPQAIASVCAKETAEGKNGIIRWDDRRANYHSVEDLSKDIREAVLRGVQIIKKHRLVGHDAVAEMKLDSNIGEHRLGGRSDISMHRVPPDDDVIILDGKGSKFRGEYVDKRQLRWYSLLYLERFKKLPDKVGFLYWRCEPEVAIDWVEVTKEDTDLLKKTVLTALDDIENRKRHLPVVPAPTRAQVETLFPPQPSRDCKWCNYISACEMGSKFMKNKGRAPLPIPDGDPNGNGVDDVGL